MRACARRQGAWFIHVGCGAARVGYHHLRKCLVRTARADVGATAALAEISSPWPREKTMSNSPGCRAVWPSEPTMARCEGASSNETSVDAPALRVTRWKPNRRFFSMGVPAPSEARSVSGLGVTYASTTSSPSTSPVFVTVTVYVVAGVDGAATVYEGGGERHLRSNVV